MKEEIKQRVLAWKRIFTEGRTDVDENSSWTDILKALKLDVNAMANLLAKATLQAGGFSPKEAKFLYSLPHYSDAICLLEQTPNESIYGNFFGGRNENGAELCFLRYPKVEEAQNAVMIIEATIVPEEPVDFDLDICVFIINGREFSKQVVIKYAAEAPEEYREEERKFLEAQGIEAKEETQNNLGDWEEEDASMDDYIFPGNPAANPISDQGLYKTTSEFGDDLPF